MTSIPLTMTWDLFGRCRNSLILSLLGTNLFCSFLMATVKSIGPVDLSDPNMTSFQLGFVLLSMIGFGVAILTVQIETSRVYVLPVDTATYVTWQMVPAMALMSLCMVLNALLINLMFDVSWPILWPALSAPVGLAMLQAALWASQKSPLQIITVSAAGAIFGIWYAFRFPVVFAAQSHPLIFLLEATPLFVMALVAHRVAILGFGRLRCGESLLSTRWDDFFEFACKDIAHLQWRNTSTAPTFQTAAAAQFWFEWRKKAWVFPTILITALTIQTLAWGVFERDFHKLTTHILVGGVVCCTAAMISGLVTGNFGRADASIEIGHFLASRPMSDRELAQAVLAVIARVNLCGWVIYLVFCAIVTIVLLATGNFHELLNGPLTQWWYFPAILFLAWIVTGVFATTYMTGHKTFLAWVICGSIAMYLLVFSTSLLLTTESKQRLFSITQSLTGVVMAIVSICVFCVSVQRRVLSAREGTIAGIVWAGLSSITVLEVLRSPGGTYALASLLVGVSSLVLFPFAAAPLALKWNRHR